MTWAKARDWLHENREAFLNAYHEAGKFDDEARERDPRTAGDAELRPQAEAQAQAAHQAGPAGPPTWRKGPKPQSILDLEKEWAEAEAAEEAARASRRTMSPTRAEPAQTTPPTSSSNRSQPGVETMTSDPSRPHRAHRARGPEALCGQRAHALEEADPADREIDRAVRVHQPGADRRRQRHHRRPRPRACRQVDRHDGGAVPAPVAPLGGRKTRLHPRRQQARARTPAGTRSCSRSSCRA